MNTKEEPQCKKEKYSGGGCPSPRLCEICETGPCVKSQGVDTLSTIIKVDINS